MTRSAVLLALTLTAVALGGPWLAPYAAQTQHRDLMHAPPMRPRLIDAGGIRAPFARPVVLADRIEQRYEIDDARALPLPWFGEASGTPVFLLGSDRLGRDVLSRVLHGAARRWGLRSSPRWAPFLPAPSSGHGPATGAAGRTKS